MGKIYTLGRFNFMVNDYGSLLEINDTSYNVVYNAFTCLAFNQVFAAALKFMSEEEISELLEEITDDDLITIMRGELSSK